MVAYLIFFVPILLLSFFVQWRFKQKFAKYAEIQLLSSLSGKEIAEKMLHDYGIFDVQVLNHEGQLTDHYNPANKTINLSTDVYFGRSVAAAAVAAHECGHAVQHAKAYAWLQFRSTLVPVVSVSSNLLQWVLLIGVLLLGFTGNPMVLGIGVVALALVTLFSFVTLPVEFDASNRALLWLKNNHSVMQTDTENVQAKEALWWAAMTYVVAALGALANLLYYASLLFGRNSED